MSDQGSEISEDRLFFFDKQDVVVSDFEANGFILDIGGGGEGVIGKLKGNQVIAIDPRRDELEEAAPGPLKIVMDARDLQFLDDVFDVVTSFFTLMYIPAVDHENVLREAFRVLSPGGRCFVWDVAFPPRFSEDKDVAVFPLTIKLPNCEIETGFGTRWPEGRRGIAYYTQLAANVGFEIVSENEQDQQLYLELVKPR